MKHVTRRIKQWLKKFDSYQHHDTTTHRWVNVARGKPVLVRRSIWEEKA
jgi:hypothetical protein